MYGFIDTESRVSVDTSVDGKEILNHENILFVASMCHANVIIKHIAIHFK